MRKTLLLLWMVLCAFTVRAQLVPAFPGAEGHGRYVTGGRGGEVRHVTNLNDNGAGSLREAVKGDKAKTVVFDVGGVIALEEELKIGANTTIAGQTAPSPGITLRYYTVRPAGDNIIIRFIRVRRGQERDVNDSADAIWAREYTGMILDHCSFSWSIDEVASFYDMNNFTMQWCTIAESLNNAGHGKGAHGYGGIWGGKLASFHHNLLAHVSNRVPRFNGARYGWTGYTKNKLYSEYKWENAVQAENVDFRNCVMFNWGDSNGCYGGPGGGQINIVNNYYKGGPATPDSKANRVTQVSVGDEGNSTIEKLRGLASRYYISGNTTETHGGKITHNRDWDGVDYDEGTYTLDGEPYTADPNAYYDAPHVTINGVSCVKIRMEEPCPTGEVTTHDAVTAFSKVLDYAGASLYRDDVDARYKREVTSGNPEYMGSVTREEGLIDLVADVEGYTEANFGTSSRPAGFDSDGDGMPDEWEIANGLNPDDPSDGNDKKLDAKGWYTNLEVYLSNVVENIMRQGNADAQAAVEEYYPVADGNVPSGIDGVAADEEDIVTTNYYDVRGVRVNPSAKGIVIRVDTMRDGGKRVTKEMR
jgi:hypothetical protein